MPPVLGLAASKKLHARRNKSVKLGRLGPGPNDDKEGRILNRVVRWGPGGLSYEADPRHAEKLIKDTYGTCSKYTRDTQMHMPWMKCLKSIIHCITLKEMYFAKESNQSLMLYKKSWMKSIHPFNQWLTF